MNYLSRLRQQGFFLFEVYPYSAWLGRGLREMRPDWFDIFTEECQITGMEQADNFAFLAFCEQSFPDKIDDCLEILISQGPDYLSCELANTFDWVDSAESR